MKFLKRAWPFVLILVLFAGFLVLSNDFDWDHFFAAAEVDLRSWLVDFSPPLWSYQLCGGSTRIGDPQAFGLSPLFLPVVLFGSLWGLKVLILGSVMLGWFFLRKVGRLIWKNSAGGRRFGAPEERIIDTLTLGVVFSNYFLWHFHHGHVTFALFYFVFGFLYFTLKFIFEGLEIKDAVILFSMAFSYLTAGFYHSAMFLVVPLSISLLALLGSAYLNGLLKKRKTSAAVFVGALILAIVASSYKTLAVFKYQRVFPRKFPSVEEIFSPFQALIFQLLPTYRYSLPGKLFSPLTWGIWEYSAFNIATWAFLAAVVGLLVLLKTKPFFAQLRLIRQNPATRTLGLWLLVLFGVAISISLPADSIFSIHSWINGLTGGSMRAIGRYQIVWVLWMFLATVLLAARYPQVTKIFTKKVCLIATALIVLNFLSFTSLHIQTLQAVLSVEPFVPAGMKVVSITERQTEAHSYMYASVLRGAVVLNCYNPISRPMVITSDFNGRPEFKVNGDLKYRTFYPLVRNSKLKSCIEGTYVTQNSLILSRDCGPNTCLNLNALNLYQPWPEGLKYNSETELYCTAKK